MSIFTPFNFSDGLSKMYSLVLNIDLNQTNLRKKHFLMKTIKDLSNSLPDDLK